METIAFLEDFVVQRKGKLAWDRIEQRCKIRDGSSASVDCAFRFSARVTNSPLSRLLRLAGENWLEYYASRTPMFSFLMDCLGSDFVLALALLPHLLLIVGMKGTEVPYLRINKYGTKKRSQRNGAFNSIEAVLGDLGGNDEVKKRKALTLPTPGKEWERRGEELEKEKKKDEKGKEKEKGESNSFSPEQRKHYLKSRLLGFSLFKTEEKKEKVEENVAENKEEDEGQSQEVSKPLDLSDFCVVEVKFMGARIGACRYAAFIAGAVSFLAKTFFDLEDVSVSISDNPKNRNGIPISKAYRSKENDASLLQNHDETFECKQLSIKWRKKREELSLSSTTSQAETLFCLSPLSLSPFFSQDSLLASSSFFCPASSSLVTWDLLKAIHPFYFEVGEDETVVEVGKGLTAIQPSLVDSHFSRFLEFEYPNTAFKGKESLFHLRSVGSGVAVIVVHSLLSSFNSVSLPSLSIEDISQSSGISSTVRIRVHYFTSARMLFLGSPLISSQKSSEVGDVNLSLQQRLCLARDQLMSGPGRDLKEGSIEIDALHSLFEQVAVNKSEGQISEKPKGKEDDENPLAPKFSTKALPRNHSLESFLADEKTVISWGELNSLYPFFLCLSQNLTVVSLGTSLSLVAPLKVGHSLDGGVLIEEPATARGKFSYHTFRSLNISEVILSIQEKSKKKKLYFAGTPVYVSNMDWGLVPSSAPYFSSNGKCSVSPLYPYTFAAPDVDQEIECLFFLGAPLFSSLSAIFSHNLSPLHLSDCDASLPLLLSNIGTFNRKLTVTYLSNKKTFVFPTCYSPSAILRQAIIGFNIPKKDRKYYGLFDPSKKTWMPRSLSPIDLGSSENFILSPTKEAPLAIQLVSGDPVEVRELLQTKAVPLRTFSNGDTLLHQLAYWDHSELLKCVLRTEHCQKCTQTVNFDGDTPLAVGIARRSTRVVALLLDFVSSSQLRNCRFIPGFSGLHEEGITALHLLCKYPWESEFEKDYLAVLKKVCLDVSLLWVFGKDDQAAFEGTAIHWAAAYGNIIALSFFLNELQVPIDLRTPQSETPLYLATRNEMWESFLYLYKEGADQFICTIAGKLVADFFLETPTDSLEPLEGCGREEAMIGGEEVGGTGIREGGRKEVERVFPFPWGGSSFLHHLWQATSFHSPSSLLSLLSSFIQNEEKQEGEWQVGLQFALLFCAFRGAYAHILAILQKYPSLSLSPLAFSSHNSFSEHNLPYTLGSPSLLGALCGNHTPHCCVSYLQVLEEISQKLPDVNGKVWYRDFAVRCGDVASVVGEGENGGLEWNVEGDSGANTCLHEAVAAGNVPAVRWLLEKGILVNKFTCQGYTEVELAILHGHTDVFQLLTESGERELKRVAKFSKEIGRESYLKTQGSGKAKNQKKQRELQSVNSCSLKLEGCNLSGFKERLSVLYYMALIGVEDERAYFSIREEMEERVGVVVGVLKEKTYSSRLHLFVSCLIGDEKMAAYLIAKHLFFPALDVEKEDLEGITEKDLKSYALSLTESTLLSLCPSSGLSFGEQLIMEGAEEHGEGKVGKWEGIDEEKEEEEEGNELPHLPSCLEFKQRSPLLSSLLSIPVSHHPQSSSSPPPVNSFSSSFAPTRVPRPSIAPKASHFKTSSFSTTTQPSDPSCSSSSSFSSPPLPSPPSTLSLSISPPSSPPLSSCSPPFCPSFSSSSSPPTRATFLSSGYSFSPPLQPKSPPSLPPHTDSSLPAPTLSLTSLSSLKSALSSPKPSLPLSPQSQKSSKPTSPSPRKSSSPMSSRRPSPHSLGRSSFPFPRKSSSPVSFHFSPKSPKSPKSFPSPHSRTSSHRIRSFSPKPPFPLSPKSSASSLASSPRPNKTNDALQSLPSSSSLSLATAQAPAPLSSNKTNNAPQSLSSSSSQSLGASKLPHPLSPPLLTPKSSPLPRKFSLPSPSVPPPSLVPPKSPSNHSRSKSINSPTCSPPSCSPPPRRSPSPSFRGCSPPSPHLSATSPPSLENTFSKLLRWGGGEEKEKLVIPSLLPSHSCLSHRLKRLARSQPPFRFLMIFYHKLDKPKKSKKKNQTSKREVIFFASSYTSLLHLRPPLALSPFSLSLTNANRLISRDILFELWLVSPRYSFSYFSESSLFGSKECELVGRGVALLDPMVLHGKFYVDLLNNEGKVAKLTGICEYSYKPEEEMKTIRNKYNNSDSTERAKITKRETKTNSMGAALSSLGYHPKFPIVLIPGVCSSALEVISSKKCPKWESERVWIDPMKIGRLAVHQRATQISQKSNPDNERLWIQHIVLGDDGVSDPKGIRVRPEQGIHGCDFLVANSLFKAQSYVLGQLIRVLREFGYGSTNLDAMTYDWRLPPSHLEIRDGYFTSLRYKITAMREINKCPVVLTGHSMGNKVIHYFLLWAKKNIGQEWIDHNIHAFLALGGPFLGAPKAVRSVVSGDRMDLDVFLTHQEGLFMCRRSASLPWLFPVDERYLPDVLSRLRVGEQLVPLRMSEIVQQSSKTSWGYFEKYFQEDDLYLHVSRETSVETTGLELRRCSPRLAGLIGGTRRAKLKTVSSYTSLTASPTLSSSPSTPSISSLSAPRKIMRPPTMEIPPVKNLWCVYGVNYKTEVSFYFKTSEQGGIGLDHAADRFSSQKIRENPRGLFIAEGIAYETIDTYQPTVRMHKCGDGTVPYASLQYPYTWGKQAEKEGKPLLVQCVEFPGVEHREMLSDESVFLSVLEFVGTKNR